MIIVWKNKLKGCYCLGWWCFCWQMMVKSRQSVIIINTITSRSQQGRVWGRVGIVCILGLLWKLSSSWWSRHNIAPLGSIGRLEIMKTCWSRPFFYEGRSRWDQDEIIEQKCLGRMLRVCGYERGTRQPSAEEQISEEEKQEGRGSEFGDTAQHEELPDDENARFDKEHPLEPCLSHICTQ